MTDNFARQLDEICLNSVRGSLFSECFLTCDLTSVGKDGELSSKYELLAGKLVQQGITPVYEKAFGCLSHYPPFDNIRTDIYRRLGFSPEKIPLSYIEGAPATKGARWAGIQMYGNRFHERSEINIKDIEGPSKCYGIVVESKNARQAFFTGIVAENRANLKPVEEKTGIGDIFAVLDASLHKAGFRMSDLARTWFHLKDILPAYDEFNRARKDSFSGIIDDDRLPASTAIQGKPASGREIVLDALAIQSKNGNGPIVRPMTSPVQPEAATYGPLFSRGMEIIWPEYKVLHISGTASIDEAGRTVHADNPEMQVRNTLNYISVLLNKYGATMQDIVQATAYFKKRELEPAFTRILEENQWSKMPCLQVVGDVCREDLFFEMDCIAVIQK